MNARNWIAALALGALTAVPAAAQTSPAAKVDDSAIKSRVETRLKNDASLKGDMIVVSVEDAKVTLTGTVSGATKVVAGTQVVAVTDGHFSVTVPTRNAGMMVAMVEERDLGGTCPNRGCTPKKRCWWPPATRCTRSTKLMSTTSA